MEIELLILIVAMVVILGIVFLYYKYGFFNIGQYGKKVGMLEYMGEYNAIRFLGIDNLTGANKTVFLVCGELSPCHQKFIQYALKKECDVKIVLGGRVKEDSISYLKELLFTHEEKVQLFNLENRPTHHFTIIGKEMMIFVEPSHGYNAPYESAVAIENPTQDYIHYFEVLQKSCIESAERITISQIEKESEKNEPKLEKEKEIVY